MAAKSLVWSDQLKFFFSSMGFSLPRNLKKIFFVILGVPMGLWERLAHFRTKTANYGLISIQDEFSSFNGLQNILYIQEKNMA